jgi:hypothetical protein
MSTKYAEYLKSEIWATIRRQRLAIDRNGCALCGSLGPIEVHHRRYPKILGQETWEDLICLCSACHTKHHYKVEDFRRVGSQTSPWTSERDYTPLCCPVCGSSNLHLGYPRELADGKKHTGGHGVEFEASWCEHCDYRFAVRVYTHKGSTYLEHSEPLLFSKGVL